MDLPVFNVNYKDCYSQTIEFETKINEKMNGGEQRYPVRTYPKRTFKLTFDKNPSGRKELEDFFTLVAGKGGKFLWTWEKSKGGNGETYECRFDSDSFMQNISEFGFSDSSLTLVAIENHPFSPVGNLDFYHNVRCDFVTEFYTIADKILTAANSAKSWQNLPKRSWTLTFEKSDAARKQLENFFIAKRGKFKAFEWTWDKEKGGDGVTYTVRFDEDTLQTDIYEYGYGKIQIKIKEVFSKNCIPEIEKDEIIPRKLLKIELEGGSIYVLDNETLERLVYDGETYLGAPLSHDEITKDDNSAVNKLNIKVSNVALAISGIIGTRGDVITNAPAVLTLVFLNVNTNELLPSSSRILYAGKCNNLKLDYENASMDIETRLGGYEIQAPVMKYRTSCQVRRFKDIRCAYSGSETSCDRTFTRCKELGNSENFRGFPCICNELVIRV